MLSLAGGRDTVNKMCGGINGADDFLAVMCQIEEEVVPTIDGKTRSQNVFTGIRNAQILKKAVRSNAVIKDAEDVGMSVVIPDREEVSTSVNLGKQIDSDLKVLQDAYVVARQIEAEKLDSELKDPNHPQSPYNPKSPYSIVAGKYGETNDLIAHPFNLIRKMDVMIADAEFSDGVTFYDFDQDQMAVAEKVVSQFNKGKKKHIDERSRPSLYTAEEDAKPIYKKEDSVQVLKGYKIVCKARIKTDKGRERIVIDTINSNFQSSFEAMADKAKLNLDVTVSAKVAAMLENFKNEQANPRGVNSDNTSSKIVKQIIFCDHLFLHNKIKRILTKRAGVPANKIAIITGQTNNEPDQMIDIQDGFNASGADNKYQVVIANKKAEVGINLQRGTQAIHHLTTGWTPDSLEQRNGRGARQGNKTEKVKIFYYDADGTFDEFKRTMIDKKDEWITSVLSTDDVSTIEVSGSITRAEQDALIRLGGNREAMRAYQADRDAQEMQARKDLAIKRYKINMQVVDEQVKIVEKLRLDDFYEKAVAEVVNLIRDNNVVYKKIYAAKSSASVKANSTKRYNATKAIILDKIEDVFDNMKVQAVDGRWKPIEGKELYRTTMSAEAAYEYIKGHLGRGESFANSNSYVWSGNFTRSILKHGSNFGNVTAVVNSDGLYQAAYDEINTTARNLIKQALLAANELADRAGMSNIKLPDDV
ncbi:MAG: helicase-related protein [Psychrobacter celer]